MQAKARSYFNGALLADRNSFEAYSNLGYLSWQEGNFEEAKRFFEKALHLKPKDELSQIFLELISAKGSQGSTQGAGKKVLIVPFALGGENLRRLGEGEALAWKLARHLSPPVQPEMIGQDLLQEEQPRELLHNPTALRALAREKGAAYIVWGELQSFPTVLVIHGQVAEVKKERAERVSHVQKGVSGRLEAAAQALAEKVSSAIFQS